ncbi:short-chain dehydrogenase/reductase SDR [Amylocystis lapponica]|nr:short-chain dehydrogenase/reductase SDR [Amylocystis lapponica]
MSVRPVIIVAGVGNGTGTGAATARVFSKAGYRVALVARNADHLKKTTADLAQAGGETASFPVAEYSYSAVSAVVKAIKAHQWPTPEKAEIRVALWNAGSAVWKPFLDITEEELDKVVSSTVVAPFAFAHEVLAAFKENAEDALGKRGTLLFTGATASLRGNTTTSAFAAGKFALRALSQSLNKEFGKQNIHVAHAVIDGGILTDLSLSRRTDPAASKQWKEDGNVRIDPESIAKSYLYLANQDRSAWTWELDLRPAHEKW